MKGRLFAAFYLDEDVSVRLASALRVRGFDVLTTRDAGRLGAVDEAQLAYAATEGRVFVTHNRSHFERMHAECSARGVHHGGIIVARRRPDPRPTLSKLLDHANRYSADEFRDLLLYI